MEPLENPTPKKLKYCTPILIKLDSDKGLGYDDYCNPAGSSADNCNEYGTTAHSECSTGVGLI